MVAVLSVCVVVGFASVVHRLLVRAQGKPAERPRPGEAIQVRVLNACGYPGAARRTMEYLRHRGIDVVEIGTADTLLSHSVVWDHVHPPGFARYVARLMGIADSLVLARPDSSLLVHCSLILGLDVLQLRPFVSR